jgi:hypothetical protein
MSPQDCIVRELYRTKSAAQVLGQDEIRHAARRVYAFVVDEMLQLLLEDFEPGPDDFF